MEHKSGMTRRGRVRAVSFLAAVIAVLGAGTVKGACEARQYRRQLQEWKESVQELLDRDSFGQHRLFKAFPGLRSTRYKEALERLRRRMGQ